MEKKLKLWNGRWAGGGPGAGRCYCAAYSVEDLVSLVAEVRGFEPRGIRGEIKNYWSAGAWGNQMKGITPERGIWLAKDDHDKPQRAALRREGVHK